MKFRKLIAVVLLATVLGVGAPATFADGPQETPGSGSSGREAVPTTPATPQESLGSMILDVMVTLATTLVA